MTVRIVTDSTADIPSDLAAELGIAVVPTYVVFGAQAFRDGVELTKQQFYEKLATTRAIPTTAAPAPAVYERLYRQLAEEADGILSIHLAGRLSGLHQVATLAAKSLSFNRIRVVDSEQVTMGCGWMAIAAAEAARRGESLERLAAMVESMKSRARVFAVLDTLEFLHRGGRVRWVSAMIGTLLQIKPLIEVYLGEARPTERARTLKHALQHLVHRIQALGPLERAIVLHTNAPDTAAVLADQLQALWPSWQRLIGQAGVTVAAHAGPGAVGVACVTAN